MLNEKIKQMILSSLLKKECKEKLITQQTISEKTGKSKQYISFIMNGTQPANPKLVADVFAMIDEEIRFNYNDDFQQYMEELTENYLSEYCYKMDDSYRNKVEEYLNEETYYSYACPEYLALQCAINYQRKNNEKVNYWIGIIETSFKEVMLERKYALLLYLLIKCELQLDNNKFNDALLTLSVAKEQASGCILGVIELFEGVAEIFLSRYLNALEHFQNAEKILLECRAYKRTLAASENIASCYAYLQMHDKARKQYEKTLLEAKRMKRKDIECICYINLCNIQFKNGDFKQALYYGECVTDKGDSIHYIAMAWSYYFMGDIDQCRKYQNILLNFDDMYIKLMVELLNLYILDSESKKKIVLLEKMMEYSEKQECHNDVLWCINFLIEEYRIIGNYRKVSDLQRLILGNLGYRSLFDKLNNVGG